MFLGMQFLLFLICYRRMSAISMVKASHLLYNMLSAKLKCPHDYYVDLLKDSISLVLFSIAQLNCVFPFGGRSDITVKAAFDGLQTTLRKWIADPDVTGGSAFGGQITFYAKLDKQKAEQEFKVDACNLSITCLMYSNRCVSYHFADMAMHPRSGMSIRSSSKRGMAKDCHDSDSKKDVCSELMYCKMRAMRAHAV